MGDKSTLQKMCYLVEVERACSLNPKNADRVLALLGCLASLSLTLGLSRGRQRPNCAQSPQLRAFCWLPTGVGVGGQGLWKDPGAAAGLQSGRQTEKPSETGRLPGTSEPEAAGRLQGNGSASGEAIPGRAVRESPPAALREPSGLGSGEPPRPAGPRAKGRLLRNTHCSAVGVRAAARPETGLRGGGDRGRRGPQGPRQIRSLKAPRRQKGCSLLCTVFSGYKKRTLLPALIPSRTFSANES